MAEFDPRQQGSPRVWDHELRSNLRTMTELIGQADTPVPAAEIRSRGNRRRQRRLVGLTGLAVLAVVAGVVAIGTALPAVSSSGELSGLASRPDANPNPNPDPNSSSDPNPTQNPTQNQNPTEGSTDPKNDVGYLIAAVPIGGELMLTFDRVIRLTGTSATAANHGVAPPGDYLIVNNNPRLRTFVVAPTARLFGSAELGPGPGPTAEVSITAAQLVQRTAAAVGRNGAGPLVTLAHSGGLDGPVTRLQEIAVPQT